MSGFVRPLSYLLEVKKKPGKLQQMYCRLSNMTIVKILFRSGNVVPMRTTIQTVLYLRTGSGMNQETLFAILRLFLLPSMTKYSGSIYSNH